MDHPGSLQSTPHHRPRRVNPTRASITTLLRAWVRPHPIPPLLHRQRSMRSLPLRSATKDRPMSSMCLTHHLCHHHPPWPP